MAGEPRAGSGKGGDVIPLAAVQGYLELTRKVNILMREEEIVHLFVEMMQRTMPDLNHAIRLIDSATGALGTVYADAPLSDEVRERIFVTESCFDGGCVPDLVRSKLPASVEILPDAPCLFRESAACILVPLADDSNLFGTIHIEARSEDQLLPFHELLATALGHHMAGAIRNARLLAESVSLRDFLGKLIEHANAPIVIIDGRRRIRTFNRSLQLLTGHDSATLIGTDFLELFEQQERQRFVSVIVKAMKGVPVTNFEVKIPRRDGTEVSIAFNITSVLDQYGKVEAVIAVGQDMTEIRRLQNQMLHSERLATIGQLAAGVVHEINNPLTSISVYSEYLLKGAQSQGAPAEDLKRLERINKAAERIFQFTQQLIAYARPSGEEPTLVDMREVITKSLGFCEHIVYKAGVTVEKVFPEELSSVYGIEGQLEQVFVNLITNACHAMKQRGGTLRIRVVEGQEGTIRIDVSDQGHGIGPDKLKRIFEPFFTTKSEGEGTGLGLPIVKNIIANHEGDISVKSTPGEGTTFTVTLYSSG